ncbi:MAG: GNAT family N-acetyltransferase [Spirochaetales bacterium]|nr:GNAT family N-acetyltransferase [Leptospiraceae bacterium]MCP5480524.1 GNAT family N-acetyltransferase [Spirochaetales bacterium]
MNIEGLSVADFNWIREHIYDFWDSEEMVEFHHSIFVREFRETAFVIHDPREKIVVAYLLGLLPPGRDYGYVHLVATHRLHRRHGLAGDLYEHFFEICRNAGLKHVRAITRIRNHASIAFHRELGFLRAGNVLSGGVPVARNYSGHGEDRYLFIKDL